jgi:hypothetical protein
VGFQNCIDVYLNATVFTVYIDTGRSIPLSIYMIDICIVFDVNGSWNKLYIAISIGNRPHNKREK